MSLFFELKTCEVCGSPDTAAVTRIPDYNAPHYGNPQLDNELFEIRKCNSCSHYFVSKRLVESELINLYRNASHLADKAYRDPRFDERLAATARVFAAHIDALGAKPKTFLEVGASHGHLLAALRELGWSVEGLEPSPSGVASCHKKGLKVAHSTFEEFAGDGRYGVVGAFSVLEHVFEVHAAIRKIARSMAENGLAYIEVPSIESLRFRISGKQFIEASVAKKAGIFHPIEHVRYFTRNSLLVLLRRFFTDVRVIEDPRYGPIYKRDYVKDIACAVFGASKTGNLVAIVSTPRPV